MYINGTLQKTYPIEIGMDTRKEGGWHPTPIGTFSISHKEHTQFYKGILFKNPGYYLIHGEGSGKGINGTDWTWGCVALSNAHMDDLFSRMGIEIEGVLISRKQRYRLLRNAKMVIVPFGLRPPCE